MSEQKLEVFNVLNFLNSDYELYLVKEGYLEGDFKPVKADDDSKEEVTAEEVSKKYTVAELKDILRENGLKVSGKNRN